LVERDASWRRALGSDGEQAVAEWYRERGFSLLARNWRSRSGEIDLVLGAGDLVIFCEVKTRTSDRFGAPIEAVTGAKVRRIRRLAAEWLSTSSGSRPRPADLRFDVASVCRTRGGFSVEVTEGAF
jgi:putative endonuclease